ncbi:Bifunctional ligase/repressor BirA [Brevundimonas sp. SH203]|uniref:biotin--[acetyl-CoA-carboxylase] ligase n=1 Tax=Brevundimonas sp. SH203 TaxID=345167 RepID=UPI0009C70355|nr:biotin--[acetyl-CoA-carboxylase] ligase [Brevundimonas sp. SH203]GAW39932.1 Bifunctional ligase/repressor BirA [Brevundimonas sp. SH203]
MTPASLVILDEIDSTLSEARRLAEAGEVGPKWIIARRQTAGRGRRGRGWIDKPGNLAATLLIRFHGSAREAAQTTFVTALAVADLLDVFVSPALVSIKWPNDVLLDGRKVSGILIESGPHPAGGLWLAIGIGVNLTHAPEGTERASAAIAEKLRDDLTFAPPIEAAAEILAETFAVWWGRWQTMGFEPVLDAWTSRLTGLNGPCTARLDNETIEGLAEGVEPDGALRLRLADGSVRLISAGDVFFGKTV